MNFQDLNLPNALVARIAGQGNTNDPRPFRCRRSPPLWRQGYPRYGPDGYGQTAASHCLFWRTCCVGRPSAAAVRSGALILTPTRPNWRCRSTSRPGDYAGIRQLRTCLVFRRRELASAIDCLKRGVDVPTATPGRLLDLIGQGHISLKQIESFVLDEADRCDDGDSSTTSGRLLPLLPGQRQTLLFSATMPKTIERLAADLLNDPVRVAVEPVASVVDTIEQRLCYVEKPEKEAGPDLGAERERRPFGAGLLAHDSTAPTASRGSCRRPVSVATRSTATKSQTAPARPVEFQGGKTRVIVATDIAARGSISISWKWSSTTTCPMSPRPT